MKHLIGILLIFLYCVCKSQTTQPEILYKVRANSPMFFASNPNDSSYFVSFQKYKLHGKHILFTSILITCLDKSGCDLWTAEVPTGEQERLHDMYLTGNRLIFICDGYFKKEYLNKTFIRSYNIKTGIKEELLLDKEPYGAAFYNNTSYIFLKEKGCLNKYADLSMWEIGNDVDDHLFIKNKTLAGKEYCMLRRYNSTFSYNDGNINYLNVTVQIKPGVDTTEPGYYLNSKNLIWNPNFVNYDIKSNSSSSMKLCSSCQIGGFKMINAKKGIGVRSDSSTTELFFYFPIDQTWKRIKMEGPKNHGYNIFLGNNEYMIISNVDRQDQYSFTYVKGEEIKWTRILKVHGNFQCIFDKNEIAVIYLDESVLFTDGEQIGCFKRFVITKDQP